ncbi:hypothetical protein BJY21_000324 [Kineosphaera limosa]|uniref:Polyketide cyclase/dehydrase n=1 Tax=Kineosphaera limosa NBRC 100340 TaxID=1184609 RepID=K6WRP8_9MICO|nr:SRPBCC family protein [Kineosphaera limosa]NYD99139.1 hypothetical protein [Kineosphaera limosa]GAB96501.1 hypothetical protein KILIM_040_00110 [Kineosphaera limosa NBRC 100340]
MAEFSVARSVHIEAPPSRVHDLIDDLRHWEHWSPWNDLDPDMRHHYTGPERGVGARHTWTGNKTAGEGSMEITASSRSEVDLQLVFVRPFPARQRARFDIVPAGGGTDVTWTMTGRQNLVGKLFFVVMRMDKRLGGDFEKGLARLKTLAQS